MNDVDVDVIAIAELGEPLGKVSHRRIDRAADQEFGIGGACGAPDDVDDAPLRSLQQRPEQPGEPHATEELQREAVEPDRIGQLQERARARRARIVDEHIATLEAFVDAAEQLLARLELAQIAGDGERLRPLRRDRLGGGGEILLGGGGEHGLRTLARERERDAAAYTAARPRNDDDLAVELTRHIPSSMLAR